MELYRHLVHKKHSTTTEDISFFLVVDIYIKKMETDRYLKLANWLEKSNQTNVISIPDIPECLSSSGVMFTSLQPLYFKVV